MSYDSIHNLGFRFAKELSSDYRTNPTTLLEVMKDLLRTCQGQIIDSKRILNSVIQLTQVKNIHVKKLVYLYLSFVTEHDSDIWLHITNSISNDLLDPSPFVRKAGILILADSHSVSDTLNDVRINNVAKSLKDPNPSVRRCAVAGIAKLFKLFKIKKIEFDMSKILDDIVQLIYLDDDASVIMECVRCLQLCERSVVKTELLISLLERMDIVEEWTKSEIVNLFSEFSNPKKMSHEEIFLVLNLLDPYLNQKHSIYLSLSCITAMLHVASRFSSTHADVKSRIVDFLISQLDIVPQHMLGIFLSVLNSVLTESSMVKLVPFYKRLLPLQSDETFVKSKKLKVLQKICSKENADLILKHITGFIMTTKETELISLAFDTLFFLHRHIPSKCVDFLQVILRHDKESIVNSAISLLGKLLIQTQAEGIDMSALIDNIIHLYDKLISPNSKEAYFWIVSRYLKPRHAKTLSDVLNAEICIWTKSSDVAFKLMLLRVVLAAYFVAPSAFQKIFGKILHLAMKDDCLLLNRQALLYYNLLKKDVEMAKSFITSVLCDSHCVSTIKSSSINCFDSSKGLCLLSHCSNI